MRAVSAAAIKPPTFTLASAALTKIDWSKMGLMATPPGISLRMSVNAARHAVDDGEGRCAACLADGDQGAGLAIH